MCPAATGEETPAFNFMKKTFCSGLLLVLLTASVFAQAGATIGISQLVSGLTNFPGLTAGDLVVVGQQTNAATPPEVTSTHQAGTVSISNLLTTLNALNPSSSAPTNFDTLTVSNLLTSPAGDTQPIAVDTSAVMVPQDATFNDFVLGDRYYLGLWSVSNSYGFVSMLGYAIVGGVFYFDNGQIVATNANGTTDDTGTFNYIDRSGSFQVVHGTKLVAAKASIADLTVEKVNGVKKYVALLTQTGTDAPVATVLENTLGGVPVWTRDSTGNYLGTLAGAFTHSVIIGSVSNSDYDSSLGMFSINDSDTISIKIFSNLNAVQDGFSATVQILVYP